MVGPLVGWLEAWRKAICIRPSVGLRKLIVSWVIRAGLGEMVWCLIAGVRSR